MAISISNLGGALSVLLGTAIGGSLRVGNDGDYSSMAALIAITAALALAPLLAIQLVPAEITGLSRTDLQTERGANTVTPMASTCDIELTCTAKNPVTSEPYDYKA